MAIEPTFARLAEKKNNIKRQYINTVYVQAWL